MKCYISKNYRHIGSAGDKAKTDIEAAMDCLGFKNIGLPQNRSKNSIAAYFITLASILKGVMSLNRDDVLVVQYPLKKYYDFVVKLARRRDVHVITVIHDLGSFRRKKLTMQEEIERLNYSSVVIVHSEAMRDWLRDHGLKSKTVVLGLFDYLSPSKAPSRYHHESRKPRLVFAGALSPEHNEWLYKLAAEQPDVELVLYGGGIDKNRMTDNMIVKGYVDSDTLIATADGDYGLVWYGDSLDEGAGALGEYLKYNAPHKTSLYLRAGLPVIIWDKAALADIISHLDTGICVPTLHNLGTELAMITPERYAHLSENARSVSERLADGHFIETALKEALAALR